MEDNLHGGITIWCTYKILSNNYTSIKKKIGVEIKQKCTSF